MTGPHDGGQLPLVPESSGRTRSDGRAHRPQRPLSAELPVARVAVLTPLPHLDRPFDYAVPEVLAAGVVPGVRVRVRLAGRLVDGFVLDRVAQSQSGRPLQPVRSVHGPPVLTPAVAKLCREVADRYAGTFADVVRAAVPPRHARVEARVLAGRPAGALVDRWRAGPDRQALDADSSPGSTGSADGSVQPTSPAPDPTGWAAYRQGRQLLAALAAGTAPRVSWCSGPGENVPARLVEAARITADGGRGVLMVVPDEADVARLVEACAAADLIAADLTARTGPQARYRTFLQVLTGEIRVVVGTRGAVFAPVHNLGLLVVLDDADDSLAEPHAPGWHAREVAALRANGEGAALVLAGPSVSLEAERMVAVGWLGHAELPRTTLRARSPRVQTAHQAAGRDPARGAARIPPVALELLREATAIGPVLVGVPRAGYVPALLCDTCREQALCPQCAAALRAESPTGTLLCPRHGALPSWSCPHCGRTRLRAAVVGARRTAEEFGRALPGVPVISSSAEGGIIRELARPGGVVVATPGAEPPPGPAGFAALLLLDVAAALSRPGLRVAEETLRRWFLAASLVRPASAGGRVLAVGDEGLREVQALVRWDPRGYAQRELDERLALSLAPAVRTARLVGPLREVEAVVEELTRALGHRLVRRSGPLPIPTGVEHGVQAAPLLTDGLAQDDAGRVAWLLGVALADGPALAAKLREVQARRSLAGAPVIGVRMDAVLP